MTMALVSLPERVDHARRALLLFVLVSVHTRLQLKLVNLSCSALPSAAVMVNGQSDQN